MFTKGNKIAVGNKGGGRKSIKQEIEDARKMITQEALIALANSKVYKQLVKIQGFKDTKEMALPITIKGIVERKDITSGGKPFPILGGITNNVYKHDGSAKTASTDKKD